MQLIKSLASLQITQKVMGMCFCMDRKRIIMGHCGIHFHGGGLQQGWNYLMSATLSLSHCTFDTWWFFVTDTLQLVFCSFFSGDRKLIFTRLIIETYLYQIDNWGGSCWNCLGRWTRISFVNWLDWKHCILYHDHCEWWMCRHLGIVNYWFHLLQSQPVTTEE